MPAEYDDRTVDNRLLFEAFGDQANMKNAVRGDDVRTVIQLPGRCGAGRIDFPDR